MEILSSRLRSTIENENNAERWSSTAETCSPLAKPQNYRHSSSTYRLRTAREAHDIKSRHGYKKLVEKETRYFIRILIALKEISHVVTTVPSPYCQTAAGGFLLSVVLKVSLKSGRKVRRGFCSMSK